MGPTISQNKASHWSPEVRPCSYEAILHVPLSDILQHGTLCAEDVPIGVLQDVAQAIGRTHSDLGTPDCMFVSNPSILQDPFQVPATRACFQELRVFKLKN